MVFFCQRFSFATKHESVVVSCEAAVVQLEADRDVSKGTHKSKPCSKAVPCYEVVFEDTVFFPEGGGQPDDRGVVSPLQCEQCGDNRPALSPQPPPGNSPDGVVAALLSGAADDASSGVQCCHGATVLRVLRRGALAVHCLDAPLAVGVRMLQTLDWGRRKDHMQQHSTQHLLTAVAEQLYGAATTSWSLGRHTSNLELDTRALTEAQLENLEAKTNAIIAAALPVSVREYARPDDLPPEARSKGLPADHVGGVRVVSIAGLDANTCCGTHVSCTAQLQAVKIIGAEPGKPGKTLVSFVAGDRVLRYLSECHGTLRALNPLLHTGPEEYVSAVAKLQRCLKTAEKCSKEALKDLAVAEAALLVQKAQTQHKIWRRSQENNESSHPRKVILVQLEDDDGHKNKVDAGESEEVDSVSGSANHDVVSDDEGPLMLVTHHRRLADMDYLNAIANSFTMKDAVLLLTAGEDKGPGALLLTGPQPLVQLLGPKLCEALEGRGGGKTRYSARVSALHRRRAAADVALSLLTQRSPSC